MLPRLSMNRILVAASAVMIVGMTSLQGQSVETFNAIRLEDPANPGNSITLSAPTGVTGYTLTFPASATTGMFSAAHSFATGGQGLTASTTWLQVPTGNTGEIPYFTGTNTTTGNSLFMWNNANQTLALSGNTGNNTLFSLAKTGTISASNGTLSISNTATSSTASANKTLLALTGSGSLGTTSAVIGLDVTTSGGTTNYAALFRNGRVGVNLGTGSTDLPNTAFDMVGDFATRESNYTSTVSGTLNNMDFTSNGNQISYVRIANAATGTITLTGLAGGLNGKILRIYNSTNSPFIIKHLSTSSSAGNRIITPGEGDMTIKKKCVVSFIYSAADQAWVTFSTSDGSAGSGGVATEANAVTGTTLTSQQNNYIRVTGGNAGAEINLENGLYVGQICVVENSMTGSGNPTVTVDGSNLPSGVGDWNIQQNESALFIWNGTKWLPVGKEQ
jgi:hypothetical protein